jgi:hypothetical protein
MLFKSNQVVTVEQARLLLGKEADSLTDDDVQQLIEDFDVIAQYAIELVQKFKSREAISDE